MPVRRHGEGQRAPASHVQAVGAVWRCQANKSPRPAKPARRRVSSVSKCPSACRLRRRALATSVIAISGEMSSSAGGGIKIILACANFRKHIDIGRIDHVEPGANARIMRAQKRVGGAFDADCVGTVGLSSARRAVIRACGLAGRHCRGQHSRQRPHWRLYIHARNKPSWHREARRVFAGSPTFAPLCPQTPARAQYKQAVADKGVLCVGQMIGNMAQRVPADIQHIYIMRAELHPVAVIHFHVNARNTLGLSPAGPMIWQPVFSLISRLLPAWSK